MCEWSSFAERDNTLLRSEFWKERVYPHGGKHVLVFVPIHRRSYFLCPLCAQLVMEETGGWITKERNSR